MFGHFEVFHPVSIHPNLVSLVADNRQTITIHPNLVSIVNTARLVTFVAEVAKRGMTLQLVCSRSCAFNTLVERTRGVHRSGSREMCQVSATLALLASWWFARKVDHERHR